MEKKKIKPKNIDLSQLPQTPGVYIFYDQTQTRIYIGKAKNLKSRLSSYFINKLAPKTAAMIAEAYALNYIKVDSEIEALLLEARLVRKYMPKYNSELKDDKSPLYIGITKEEFPRVITLRFTELKAYKLRKVFGPFLDSTSAKKVLRFIRRIFPFSTHKLGKRACLYNQIGLCSPCPNVINSLPSPEREVLKKHYLRNINHITLALTGKLKRIEKILIEDMGALSEAEQFEKASEVAKKLEFLRYVTTAKPLTDPYLENPNFLEDVRSLEQNSLEKILSEFFPGLKLIRIECFDIAHLSGTFPTASMVTFINGEPDKNYYRHFRMFAKKRNNDTESMIEVLRRRKKHFSDWGKPDLIIVDGGKGQVSAALSIIQNEVPVVGIAKRFETLIIKTDKDFKSIYLRGPALSLVQRIRDEAHRFARRYHHTLVSRTIKNTRPSH